MVLIFHSQTLNLLKFAPHWIIVKYTERNSTPCRLQLQLHIIMGGLECILDFIHFNKAPYSLPYTPTHNKDHKSCFLASGQWAELPTRPGGAKAPMCLFMEDGKYEVQS